MSMFSVSLYASYRLMCCAWLVHRYTDLLESGTGRAQHEHSERFAWQTSCFVAALYDQEATA